MIYKFFSLITVCLLSYNGSITEPKSKIVAANAKSAFEMRAESIFANLDANNFDLPKLESFEEGLKGFERLKEEGKIKNNILTIVDFGMSSCSKRLWVIDMESGKVLFHSLVAHGKNSGDDIASFFSNKNDSNQSSLGFYVTGEVYNGKHGISMKLDGQEPGVNDNARSRSVVMHGADYVSDWFVKLHNRLGRSQGCPAIPMELTNDIINTLKNGSCLYIHHPSRLKAKTFGSLS
ncbi:MAG: murein L,D-transpeptidase catalytic domain family protein [Flavobacterium sp.]|nr:MAG: murein L,D-transpeptidase catalytic domain family protein [Flavobacterium sp.]